jgi:hypothetical protein
MTLNDDINVDQTDFCQSRTGRMLMRNDLTWMKSITYMKELVKYQSKFGYSPAEIQYNIQKYDISKW